MNHRLSITSRSVCVAFVLAQIAILSATHPVRGADEEAAKIKAIYERTKSAKSLADFTAIIEACESARTRKLTEANLEYLDRLASWAHNRRGETYADQAAALVEKGDSKRSGDLDEMAMKDFEKAIKYDAKRWKSYHNRGVSFAMLGKYEEAIKDFTKVIEMNSKYANAWFNRAEIHYELAEYSKAINDYDRVVELTPQDFGAYTNRGHSFFQLRRLQEAIADYNQAVRLAPNNADAFTNRGDAHRASGQWEKAASDYRQAVTLDKEDGRAYQSAAWLMATCPDERFRNGELAVQAAEKAIVLDGAGDYKYLDTLAAAHANAGNYDEAKSNVAKAIQLAPESEVLILRERYKLYEKNKPFRQILRTAVRAEGPAVR